jgi:hypothetical protein
MTSETILFSSVAGRRAKAASTWTREEICRLRELAQSGTPLHLISRMLRRTESAVRNKAGMHGISLQASGSKASAQSLRPQESQEVTVLKRVSAR